MTRPAFVELTAGDIGRLAPLHAAYKLEIGEDAPGEGDLERLVDAMRGGRIRFFGCEAEGRLVGCCSVAPTWSTFNYAPSGVFEDFYIEPEWRRRGLARQLVRFAAAKSGVRSLTVGCADCDREMYAALGFAVPLGNLLAYAFEGDADNRE